MMWPQYTLIFCEKRKAIHDYSNEQVQHLKYRSSSSSSCIETAGLFQKYRILTSNSGSPEKNYNEEPYSSVLFSIYQ